MKKLICILAVLTLASCAFADLTATGWFCNDGILIYADVPFTADYPPAGFTVGFPNYNPETFWYNFYAISDNVGGWLYNVNDSFTVTFDGFGDNDFSSADGSLAFYVSDVFQKNWVCYRVPWSGNGAYTFTAEDIVAEESGGDYLEGLEVDLIEMILTPKINSHASGRVTVSLNTTEEETVVPEPGTIAYALAGLGSLAGMKKRFVK